MSPIITSLFLLHGALAQAPVQQIGGQELCAASAVDPVSALAADVLPLSIGAACKLVQIAAVSKLNPTDVRWLDARTNFASLPTLDQDLASNRIWLTQGQAHTWLSGAKANVVVIVGTGLDDHLLAARCGQMFHSTRARILQGGITHLSAAIPMLSANEALTALLRAEPNTLTLSSLDRVPPDLAMRLHNSGVRVESIASANPKESTAVIRLRVARSKRTLSFNIVGGTNGLIAAYQQYTALALAPKIEPRRPCYFP